MSDVAFIASFTPTVSTLTNGGSLLDGVSYGLQASDYSIGRLPSGGTNWVLNLPTPGSLNLAAQTGDPGLLRLNEWMAKAITGSDWFELYNPNAQPVSLSGLFLTDNITTPAGRQKFQIAPLSFIGTDLYGYAQFFADNNPAAGPDHVSFALKKSGQSLGLFQPGDLLIDALTYGAQTTGISEGRLPDGSTTIVRFPATATPGDANYLPLTNVVVSEVLTAIPNGAPLEQAIELQNVSGMAVNVGGWYLSNQKRHLKKFRIPDSTMLAAGAFIVFYEYQFNADPHDPAAFRLDPLNGDNVYLSVADVNANLTGYRAEAPFGPAESGVSFGRYVTSTGNVDFPPMNGLTFGVIEPGTVAQFRTGAGASNTYPKVEPVVINEIMYHPPDLGGVDDALDEYIELYNSGTRPVPLFDPFHATNTWQLQNAVSFTFPTNLTLASNGYLLVVSFDPVNDPASLAAFQAYYSLGTNVALVGPYAGKLPNSDAKVELWKPGTPTNSFVPYILVERVHYYDALPWTPDADGSGAALNRNSVTGYGNDPTNWLAGPPSPGGVSLPLITTQPASQQVVAGQTAGFTVGAWSMTAVGYQWRFQGLPIPGATLPTLMVPNVQATNTGVYDVVVTNRNGFVVSAPATLGLNQGNVDSDGDGIPDWWMVLYFGHATGSAADKSLASQDADGDGLTNYQEYLTGTSPIDPNSTLKLVPLGFRPGFGYAFQFDAVTNQTYSVMMMGGLGGTNQWRKLFEVPAQPSNGPLQVIDFSSLTNPANRFYRIHTPAQP